MDVANHLLFPTPLGPCGLVWSAAGLTGVHLPERDEAQARAALRRRFPGSAPGAPPARIATLTARIAAHLGGAKVDYDDVVLDSGAVGAFEMRVYALARAIPPGETATYGALARRLGDVALARAVGQALGRNPWPIVIPCHRVTAADGRAGGFSAPGGRATKLRLLEIEGALAPEALPLFAATAEFKQG
jgi:methylated-DNA-[protein]-cysteine S-methyltransferase